jgi:hypothetical protein
VFNGDVGRFAGGIFTTREAAEAWIANRRLSGTLTRYPIDVGVYEWAIDRGLFTPKEPHETSARFIGSFTTARQDHHHYEDGERVV